MDHIGILLKRRKGIAYPVLPTVPLHWPFGIHTNLLLHIRWSLQRGSLNLRKWWLVLPLFYSVQDVRLQLPVVSGPPWKLLTTIWKVLRQSTGSPIDFLSAKLRDDFLPSALLGFLFWTTSPLPLSLSTFCHRIPHWKGQEHPLEVRWRKRFGLNKALFLSFLL